MRLIYISPLIACFALMFSSPLFAEEQIVDQPDLQLFDKFAPILSMADGSALVFRNNSELNRLWPGTPPKQEMSSIKGFNVPYYSKYGSSTLYPAEYASVATARGVWLVGATVEFIGPANQHITGQLNFPRIDPGVVALSDGSLLVAGGLPWSESLRHASKMPEMRSIERVTLTDDGHIKSEYVAPLPDCTNPNCRPDIGFSPQNFAMVNLGHDRIMLAGGYYNQNAYIYDASKNQWRSSGALSQMRINFTLTLLPDGRVLAAGGNEAFDDLRHEHMTTEIWDPKTEHWIQGPTLPVPLMEHSALLVDNKTVILAGGRFAGVLAWDIGKPYWRVAAKLASARNKAGVLYLGNGRLAIIAGVRARVYEEGWGRRNPGYSIVDIPSEDTYNGLPTGYGTTGQAFAQQGTKLFVAGGKITSSYDGSIKIEPAATVELYNSKTHTVRSLPPLPFGAALAKAIWLDESRVLIMALSDPKGGPMWFGIIDTRDGKQTALPLPRIGYYSIPKESYSKPNSQEYANGKRVGVYDEDFYADLQLVHGHGKQALIASQIGGLYWLDTSNNTFTEIPRLPKLAHRMEAQIRQLSHGKIIQAGNQESYNLVLSRVEGCGNCPEKFIESDENLSLSTYDSFEPETKSWQKSAPAQAFGGPIAILADGRVAKMGKITEREKNTADTNSPVDKSTLLLELSNTDGTHWDTLKLPVPVSFLKTLKETHRLLTPANLEGELGGLLFLGVSTGNDSDLDWWWINLNGTTPAWQHLNLSQTWKSDWQVQNDVYFGQIKLSGHDLGLVISAGGVVALEN